MAKENRQLRRNQNTVCVRGMAKVFFLTIMTIAMLMIAAPVAGSAVFADNDYVNDRINPPGNIRFEGPYVCWDRAYYEYTFGPDEDDVYHPGYPGSNDRVTYTVEVYKINATQDETLLKSVKQTETRYDLTDISSDWLYEDEDGREYNDSLQVRIKAVLTFDLDKSLESEWNSSAQTVPCPVVYFRVGSSYPHSYAFVGWPVIHPADPEEEGSTFLYWKDSAGAGTF